MTAEWASLLELTLSPNSWTDTTLTSYAEPTRSHFSSFPQLRQPCRNVWFNLHSGSIMHVRFKSFAPGGGGFFIYIYISYFIYFRWWKMVTSFSPSVNWWDLDWNQFEEMILTNKPSCSISLILSRWPSSLPPTTAGSLTTLAGWCQSTRHSCAPSRCTVVLISFGPVQWEKCFPPKSQILKSA